MTAKIIGVMNQKGGVGKTTITMLLAAEFVERGLKVAVADADGQNSCTAIAKHARIEHPETPFPATVLTICSKEDTPEMDRQVHLRIKEHINHYDLIVVDCPPSIGSAVPASLLLIADVALLPLTMGRTDVDSTKEFVGLCKRAQSFREDLRCLLIPNKVKKNTNIAEAVLAAVPALGLPVASKVLYDRTSVGEAVAEGRSLRSMGATAKLAVDELSALADDVESMLKEPVHG